MYQQESVLCEFATESRPYMCSKRFSNRTSLDGDYTCTLQSREKLVLQRNEVYCTTVVRILG